MTLRLLCVSIPPGIFSIQKTLTPPEPMVLRCRVSRDSQLIRILEPSLCRFPVRRILPRLIQRSVFCGASIGKLRLCDHWIQHEWNHGLEHRCRRCADRTLQLPVSARFCYALASAALIPPGSFFMSPAVVVAVE